MTKQSDPEEVVIEEETNIEAGEPGQPAEVETYIEQETELESDETVAEAAPLNLAEQLELAHQEAAQNKENWQRAVAELVNYKRRQEEQRKLLRDRIKSEVLEGVISALDDLDLAFQNVPEELDGQLVGWVEGFRLVSRKLDKILDDQNVMPINTEGEFDPNLHEAVSYEESEAHGEGQIIAELRKGYQIGNRVIRPALVRVAK
jgi:molecular chaperone GrpE